MTNQELQTFYFGAYSFRETEDGWLQAFQYSKEQMGYFESCIAKGLDFWYERCMATTAKTLEMTTDAGTISFEYRFIWTGSQDSFELAVDGQITEIRYVRDLPEEGELTWRLPEGKKKVVIYLPADATVLLRNCRIDGSAVPPEKTYMFPPDSTESVKVRPKRTSTVSPSGKTHPDEVMLETVQLAISDSFPAASTALK